MFSQKYLCHCGGKFIKIKRGDFNQISYLCFMIKRSAVKINDPRFENSFGIIEGEITPRSIDITLRRIFDRIIDVNYYDQNCSFFVGGNDFEKQLNRNVLEHKQLLTVVDRPHKETINIELVKIY